MKKKSRALVTILLVTALLLLVFNQTKAYAESATSPSSNQNNLFTPNVSKPAWVDQDNNGIADSLDREIADRIANGTAQNYVNVTVMLKAPPTTQDAEDFVSSGGYVTTSPWTEAIYGFGGMIAYNEITSFTEQCPNVLLVEKEAIGKTTIAYAAQQVGARTYAWNTLGLQGDPNSSIAVVDTGIDGSHVDFAPGYGDQNFAKKIVGWNDQVGSTISPVDDNGHGSHCSGLAAGDGFFSVNASGNAITTWGGNLGSVSSSGTYFISGMMVNKTGTIGINVKWAHTGTASLSALVLYYGDKILNTGSWTQVASVSTPSQNTFYSLTYNVASTPSGGYDMYHVLMSLTAGTGDLYVAFNMSWPYTPPSDGFSAWTGIAPQSKLVGVKVMNVNGSGTDTQLISGINWIISNRMTYHITVVSMSLGFGSEVSTVDSAILNMVNSGITVVVSAGNSGPGTNYIYTPGSVDEVITVAAMNQFDNVVSYSSQGGTSRYTGKTTKPDITAPGGSFYAVPLYSVDSNYNDAEGQFTEIQANDSAPMQGTSMAAPVISGCAQILFQALGGYAKWNWTRSQALQPKMLMLMTATETYPNLREGYTSTYAPTLERGGKDVHEGYGRVNLDAAVDALLRPYGIGSAVTDTLGRPPTLTDISVLGQRLAWARNVRLIAGGLYNFSLSVPTGGDYDLYLYNSTGTAYGEPAIVAKSVNATTGGTEQFWVTAPYTGTYYLVVKRATETTGSGTFTLSSSGPVSASLVVRGLDNRVYYRIYNPVGGVWGTWNALPGATIDSPAAATLDNELHIVVRGTDGNTLWHGYVSLINQVFSGWTLLSGSTPSAPTLTANSTHLCLAVRGQNNLIYYRFYTVGTRTWTGWAALPTGVTVDGPAATVLANKLHVVVRGMDGSTLWHGSVDLSTAAFSGWDLVGGATQSKPTLTKSEPRNEVWLVVRGLNNVIYRNSWSASGWTGWVGLPSGSTGDGVGATVIGEALHVVVRGMYGSTLWHGNVTLSTSAFSGWTLLSGSTPSTPTLTS